jgi:hypothetical protein
VASLLSTEDSEPFSATWPTSGSMRNGRCYQRQPWAPRTGARGSGSWPTATAADSRASGGALTPSQGHGMTQTDRAVRLWPTPVARDDQKTPEAHMASKARMAGGPRHQPTSLTVVAKLWPTPTAADGNRRTDPPPTSWSPVKPHGPSLTRRAGTWPTPQARDHKGAFTGHRDGGLDLPSEASLFPAGFPSGHPHPTTTPPGPKSSPPVVLNPAFVEWLMGYPPGWSASTPSATASRQWWQEQHSSLLHAALGSWR